MKKRILMTLLAVAVLMMDIQMVHAEEMVAAPEEATEVEAVGAEGEHISSDGFIFTLDSTYNYYAIITGYRGAEENITVPATITDETGTYEVKEIGDNAFGENDVVRTITIAEGIVNVGQAFNRCPNLLEVNFPSTIAHITEASFNDSIALRAINVSEGSQNFFSRDGVLFFKADNKIMLQTYPANRSGDSYIVDKDVDVIKRASFRNVQNLREVTIPSMVKEIDTRAFNASVNPLTISYHLERVENKNDVADDAFYELPTGSKIITGNSTVAAQLTEYLTKRGDTQIISLENDPSYRKAATDLRFTADGSNTKNMTIGVGDVDTSLRTSYMISPADTTDNVTWEVEEGKNIAKVDPVSGCITGLETGDCKIVGTDESGHSLTVNLTVYKAVENTVLWCGSDDPKEYTFVEGSTDAFGNKMTSMYVTYKAFPVNANNAQAVAWSSSRKDVADVVEDGGDIETAADGTSYYANYGMIKFKAPGTTTITATLKDGDKTYTKSFVLNVTKPLVNVDTLSVSSIKAQTYTGKAITPAITVKDGSKVLKSGTDYTVTYTNNVNPGTAAVTIKGIGSYTGERSVSFKIEKKNSGSAAKQISKTTISGIKTKTYTGKAITQAVTVRDGSKVLKAGTDYTVSYKGNKNAGKASVIITGKNGYTGSVTKYFTIRKADQKIKAASSYKKPYGSKAFTVSAKRTAGNGKLTYKSSNKKVAAVNGKGKVAIKGTGIAVITVTAEGNTNYNKKAVKITITSAPKQEKLVTVKSRSKKKLEVKWSKDTRATGYEVQYSTSSKFKSKTTKTVQISKNKTTGQTIKKLKSGKKYYVRVRAYKKCGKKKLCGQWSKVKNVKIR